MTNRLTPEALDALLAEHADYRGRCLHHDHEVVPDFPCTIYLLASEVRDAREAIDRPRNGHIHVWMSDSKNMAVCIFCSTGFPRDQHMPKFRGAGPLRGRQTVNPDSQADTETIDIWADEGGLQLVLHRFPSGKIMVGIDAIRGTDRERLAVVTIARFRVGRIVHFLTPEETEAQHQRAVQAVRNLIKEATGPEPAEVVRAKMRDLISKIESGEASSQTGSAHYEEGME